MSDLRIISFLPAATEMVYALGLGDALVGVSHECDFPTAARTKPVIVKPALALEKMSLSEIDRAVAERIGSGQNLYQVDEALLRSLRPNLIVTQNLCQVCGPAGNEVTVALKALSPKPEILWMTPHSLAEILQNLRELGTATGQTARADQLIASLQARMANVAALTREFSHRPRVFCLEWVDPYYCCGHWVPEMIELAGGADSLGRRGTDSVRIPWTDIAAWSPEVLIVSPCGFCTKKAVEQAEQLLRQPGWSELPAVRSGRVYAVDANAYFARPGPRVVDGVELLAHLIHPQIFPWSGPAGAFRKIEPSRLWPLPVRLKTCPECRAKFACGPQADHGRCWCDDLPPLSAEALSGSGCLCPECLKARV